MKVSVLRLDCIQFFLGDIFPPFHIPVADPGLEGGKVGLALSIGGARQSDFSVLVVSC